MTRAGLDTVFNGLTMAATLACLSIYAYRQFHRPTPIGPTAEVEWRSYLTRGERLGAVNPTVTITEFSDFKCPFCLRLKGSLDTILQRYPNDVAVVFRHFPIAKLHPDASAAAYASICAAKQGRFHAFYDLAFQRQDSLGKLRWATFAAQAGVQDTVAFSRCLSDSVTLRAIPEDRQAGQRLKVRGTPTVLVNQWRMRGTPSTATLDSAIQRELRIRRSSAVGVHISR